MCNFLKAVFLMFVAAIAFSLTACGESSSDSNDAVSENTVLVYEGIGVEMTGTMAYSLSIGPLDVSTYDQIRLSTSLNSGSGTTTVQVYAVDEEDNYIGYIDQFNLVAGGTEEVSNVYDVPGQRIKISYDGMNHNYINCLVYGR
jgi:hypothetical protein